MSLVPKISILTHQASLKTKVAAAITMLVAILLITLSVLAFHFFQKNLKDSISRQNFTLVSSLAHEVDSKIQVTQNILSGMAEMVPIEGLSSSSRIKSFFLSRKDNRVIFDNDLMLFSPNFDLLGSIAAAPSTSPHKRPFQRCLEVTLETKAPQISKPFFSKKKGQRPVVMFTAPVLTESNTVVAILAGSIDLLNDNFLGHLTQTKLGDKGYLYIYDHDRTIILHSDLSRILKQDVPVGSNRLFDKALEGFEGTDETISSRGLHALSSFKQLSSTNWILAANFPVAEAHAPVHQAQRHFIFALVIALPLFALGTWFLMHRLLAPLEDLTRQVQEYSDSEPAKPIQVDAQNELGVLADSFNLILDKLSQKRRALADQLNFLQVLIDVMPNPVFFKDAEGLYLGCNKAFEEKLGIPKENLLHKSVFEIAPAHLAREYHKADAALFNQGVDNTQVYEAPVPWKDGSQRQVVFYKATFSSPDGNLGGLVGTIVDTTERRQAEKKLIEKENRLDFLTKYDKLTSLPNRELFYDRLQHALAKARGSDSKVAVLLLDLDRFKTINDSFGHELGNKVLCLVAERLETQVGKSDTLARLGGDEFALILEDAEELNNVLGMAQDLLNALAPVLYFEGHNIYMSASIGISIFPNDGADFADLMKGAETAMYRAKEQGHNTYQFYRPEMNLRSRERLLLEGALQQAISLEQFTLCYQPQIDLITSKTVGAEALVRWHHPTLGVVSPGDFIPLAEETGLIIPLGDWVLKRACQQIKDWAQKREEPFRIAVNISALQFREPNFIDKVDSILKETQIDPRYLEMEITESVIMTDVDSSIMTLTDLKVRGISLALDDFGTGYSSLNYLRKFPITHLKIDYSFVKDVCTNRQSAEIAASIIGLAKNMQLKVIAEGIETLEQLAFLKDRGCDEGQGFLFKKAIPPEDFAADFL